MKDLYLMPIVHEQPFYPNGKPIQPNALTVMDKDIYDWFMIYSNEKHPEYATEKDNAETVLKQYAIYYIHAPLFKVNPNNENLYSQVSLDMPFDELFELCLDYGIDPF